MYLAKANLCHNIHRFNEEKEEIDKSYEITRVEIIFFFT